MQFLCVEFGKADDPDPLYPQLPFTVEGVTDDFDLTPNPENLIGCSPFPSCYRKNYVFVCLFVVVVFLFRFCFCFVFVPVLFCFVFNDFYSWVIGV